MHTYTHACTHRRVQVCIHACRCVPGHGQQSSEHRQSFDRRAHRCSSLKESKQRHSHRERGCGHPWTGWSGKVPEEEAFTLRCGTRQPHKKGGRFPNAGDHEEDQDVGRATGQEVLCLGGPLKEPPRKRELHLPAPAEGRRRGLLAKGPWLFYFTPCPG